MPNRGKTLGNYIPTGDPDTMNESSLYAPGELGQTFDYNDRTYQIVKLDSGAITNADTTGTAPAANDVLFWKNKSNYLVTNDYRQSFTTGGGGTSPEANAIAGILRIAATRGNYIAMLVRGRNIAVADQGGSCGKGEIACADIQSNRASVLGIAAGTAATHKPVGIVRTATAASVAYVDVDIPEIP